jgi:methylamine dehydrogenase accessory protein MauD
VDWLAVSNGVLWVSFVAVLLVNIVMSRQIGELRERVAEATAMVQGKFLEIGSKAPQLALASLTGQVEQIGKVSDGRSQLLLFLSPGCPVCAQLIPALQALKPAEDSWLGVVLAGEGDQLEHRSYWSTEGLENFSFVVSSILSQSYGVSQRPYAVLINDQGTVVSSGGVASPEQLQSLFEIGRGKVASLHEYRHKRDEQV